MEEFFSIRLFPQLLHKFSTGEFSGSRFIVAQDEVSNKHDREQARVRKGRMEKCKENSATGRTPRTELVTLRQMRNQAQSKIEQNRPTNAERRAAYFESALQANQEIVCTELVKTESVKTESVRESASVINKDMARPPASRRWRGTSNRPKCFNVFLHGPDQESYLRSSKETQFKASLNVALYKDETRAYQAEMRCDFIQAKLGRRLLCEEIK